MRTLLRRLRYAIARRHLEHELEEEIAFHREMRQREIEADGTPPAAAASAARRALGNDALARNQARDVWTSERGRALQLNPARLAGPPQQLRRIRQFLTTIEVQLDAVRIRADCKNALVPAFAR